MDRRDLEFWFPKLIENMEEGGHTTIYIESEQEILIDNIQKFMESRICKNCLNYIDGEGCDFAVMDGMNEVEETFGCNRFLGREGFRWPQF